MKLNIVLVAICIIGIYFLYFKKEKENFTNQDIIVNEIVKHFMFPPENYTGYSNILLKNNNSSINMTKLTTYNFLKAKGKNIKKKDVEDVLI